MSSPLRLYPAYDAINQFSNSANSTYNGATVTLNRQLTDDFQFLAGYTFSKAIDNGSFDSEQPQNPHALRDERPLSLQDRRHRLTLSGLWLIGPDLTDPQDTAANAIHGTLMRLLTGLTTKISPLLNIAFGSGAAAQMRFGRPIGASTPRRKADYPRMESAVIEVTRGACDIT